MEPEVQSASPPGKRRRGDGLWKDTRTPGMPVWCIRYKGLDGRHHRERTEARTREQAMMILSKRKEELFKARIVGAHTLETLKPMSFEDFVKDEYLPHCKATHTPQTHEGDQSLATVLLPHFGRMQLRAIGSGDIQRYVDQEAGRIFRPIRPALDEKGRPKRDKDGKAVLLPAMRVRPATVNRKRTFLSGVLSEAVRRGYIDRNPVKGVSILPEHNDKLRWLTAQEEERLLVFSPDYLRPVLLTALHTGMRKGEVLGLKWPDLDFEQRLVRAAHTKNHRVRYIPMNAQLIEILHSVLPFVGEEGTSPYVFTNPETGTRYKDLSRPFEQTCRKAGIEDVTFHTLRHTFASRLAQAGVPLNTVRELLGHGDMGVTMRYAHLAPNNLREAVELLVGVPMRTRSVQAKA